MYNLYVGLYCPHLFLDLTILRMDSGSGQVYCDKAWGFYGLQQAPN
jgi:hypothetical protein